MSFTDTDETILDPLHLPNGITVLFTDRSRRYFGDYHTVRIEASGTLSADPALVTRLGGDPAVSGVCFTFRVQLKKSAVPTAAVPETVAKLVGDFRREAQRYMATELFAERLIVRELRVVRKPPRSFLSPVR